MERRGIQEDSQPNGSAIVRYAICGIASKLHVTDFYRRVSPSKGKPHLPIGHKEFVNSLHGSFVVIP